MILDLVDSVTKKSVRDKYKLTPYIARKSSSVRRRRSTVGDDARKYAAKRAWHRHLRTINILYAS